jgi:hypothetical protein
VDDRRERLARNAALFREVNERIREVGNAVGVRPDEALEMVCECSSAECSRRISMTRSEYEDVRAEPELFILVPGHTDPSVESVVARRDRYWVARKLPGTPSRVAAELDPRS